MTSNRADLSPTDTFSAWDYFEESSTDKPSTREGQPNLSIPTHHFTSRSADIVFEPLVLPTPTNMIRMTVVSPETSVHEAIKAIGISENYTTLLPRQYSEGKKIYVMKQSPQMTVIPVTSVRKSIKICNENSSVQNVDNEDEDWDRDMPVLTPEEPFKPEQLSSSKSFELERFYCSICKRELQSKHALMKHIKLHGAPKYKCNKCDRQFFERTKLRRHQIVHSTEKKFKCSECQRSFVLEHNLKIHIRIHHSKTSELKEESTEYSDFKEESIVYS